VNANAKYCSTYSSLANSKSLLSSLLLGQSHLLILSSSLDILSFLCGDELNVAVGRQIGSNSTMSSVGPSSALDSSLNSEVGNDASVSIQTLSLSVSKEVL
jgi:hypothetical protein